MNPTPIYKFKYADGTSAIGTWEDAHTGSADMVDFHFLYTKWTNKS